MKAELVILQLVLFGPVTACYATDISLSAIPHEATRPAIDGRAVATWRLSNVTDYGIVLRHGRIPGDPDYKGARDVWVFKEANTYYMHYDGAGPKGWLSNLATSKDLFNWEKKGPILTLGGSGSLDSGAACYGTTYLENGVWYLFYLGTPNTSPAPELIPSPPYYTLAAEAFSPNGPWTKTTTTKDALPLSLKTESYYQNEASPGQIVKDGDEYLMFFSGAKNENGYKRTIGIARARSLQGKWSIDDKPALPAEEQIENASLFFQEPTKTWFLFTNHLGLLDQGGEEANAIWVYWTKDLNNWDPKNKAVALDPSNVKWTNGAVGLPSVIQVGDRLAVFYDGSAVPSSPNPADRNIFSASNCCPRVILTEPRFC